MLGHAELLLPLSGHFSKRAGHSTHRVLAPALGRGGPNPSQQASVAQILKTQRQMLGFNLKIRKAKQPSY